MSAKLNQDAFYKTKIQDGTRCTSIFEKLQRHVCFRQSLSEICGGKVESLFHNQAQKKKSDYFISSTSLTSSLFYYTLKI